MSILDSSNSQFVCEGFVAVTSNFALEGLDSVDFLDVLIFHHIHRRIE